MPIIITTPQAREDIESILDFIAIDRQSPQGAESLLNAFQKKCEFLASHPKLGDVFSQENPDLRISPFGTKSNPRAYVILFRPLTSGIEVVRVFHGARDYRSLF